VPAPFFIYLNGHGNCKRPQPDIETARTEAKRLYDLNEGRARVLILETLEITEADPNAPPPPPPPEPPPPVEKSAAKPQKVKKQPPAPAPKPASKPVVVEVRKKRRIEVPSTQS
jgi:outer membrane biosynthesis protein TonB